MYVTGTGKKFRLVNLDTTQSSSWHEVSEGGGGSGLPSGGTAGQYLVKQSATEGDADWQSLNAFTGATSQAAGAAGLVPAPAIGDEGKVLFGDGSWGNIVMPSVDYSQQSVEANIFDTTEKVIGQWTDGKLLYQKVVDLGTLSNAMDKIVDVSGKSTMDVKYIYGEGYNSSGRAFFIPKAHDRAFDNQLALQFDRSYGIEVYSRSGEFSGFSAFAVLQYTKTTDSPLASDEKYAGLTASGEVIYKKLVDCGALPNNTTKAVSVSSLGISKVVDYRGMTFNSNNTNFRCLPFVGDTLLNNIRVDITNSQIIICTTSDWSSYNATVTLYYTKTS